MDTPSHASDASIGQIRRALISVSDKTGLVELGRALHDLGIDILASGGTSKTLQQAGIPVTPVQTFTGASEVLGGRVKTLHPRIHAGILADRRNEAHLQDLEKHGYLPIDLVVCNLYPFEAGLKRQLSSAEQIELIDIGGPTLIRAAAKNAEGGVTVLSRPATYSKVIDRLKAHPENPTIAAPERRALATQAFLSIAEYDTHIAGWYQTQNAQTPKNPVSQNDSPDQARLNLPAFSAQASLRYGENPHQSAHLYVESAKPQGVAAGTLLQGKALSYNNYLDLDAAYRCANGLFEHPTEQRCAVIKHSNPCGLAQKPDQVQAFLAALSGDPMSAFGSVIGFNQPLTLKTAQAMLDSKLFVECIVAPEFEPGVAELLAAKKNLRLLQAPKPNLDGIHTHRISGGLLVQEQDRLHTQPQDWACVTTTKSSHAMGEICFAFECVALLKSNAIAITQDMTLRGIGTGQTSRVDACKQAIAKAGDQTRQAVLASDAFFPFSDCVELAASAEITTIVQPGGSKRDQDSIDACNQTNIAMLLTNERHFRH